MDLDSARCPRRHLCVAAIAFARFFYQAEAYLDIAVQVGTPNQNMKHMARMGKAGSIKGSDMKTFLLYCRIWRCTCCRL